MRVADLGAGSGAYAMEAARMVVPGGRVIAVEVLPDLITRIKNDAAHARISNIDVIHGNIEKLGGTKIAEGSIDRVIASNILFQVEDKDAFIREAARIMKRGGELLLIDWSGPHGGMGPHHAHVILAPDAEAMFLKHGFEFLRKIDAGAHHYGMILKRK